MIRLVHWLIVLTYCILPAAMLARGIFLFVRKGRRKPLQRFWIACFSGTIMGVLVSSLYAVQMQGKLIPSQVLLAVYFACALLLLLKGFDHLLWIVLRSALRLRSSAGPSWWFGVRATTAMLVRAALLFGVGLPYILAVSLTYRPHVAFSENPSTLFQRPFQRVQFSATDGVPLVGWWIPAIPRPGPPPPTVLLCPGLAATKATQLHLAVRLMQAGYNIFIFDFRGHGESGGELTSFGDLERRDVLGAVQWLQTTHPKACNKLVGLGVNTGAAALIAAAADPGPQGQNIDAIAVYGTFDSLDSTLETIAGNYLPSPLSWLVRHVGLPLASAQVGSDLSSFSPANDVKALWPRPILVIHGLDDEIVNFQHGQSLYDAAFQPKYDMWIKTGGHYDVIESDAAAREVRQYFDGSEKIL
jgi:fermentation-respiration switch protein FrsA (DUF1100 family)